MIHFTAPKIDISSELSLDACLKSLGVTDLMRPDTADFTGSLTPETGFALSETRQMARFVMNEDGIEAAAITVFPAAGALPMELEVDFVLNRPFLFAAVSPKGLPLFIGVFSTP